MKRGIYAFSVFLFMFPQLCLGIPVSHSATLITFAQPIHFLAVDGSDVVIEPGSYQIEAADEWLRLIPGERRNAILLEAVPKEHQENLEVPKVLSNPGEAEDHHLVLLLPGGKGLEAIGSVSGIRSRAVTRARISRSSNRTQQKSRKPTQTTDVSVRVQKLENQVRSLQATINALQSRLNKMESAIQVNSGNVTVNGATLKVTAGMVDVQAGLSKFSGVVKADTVTTNSVISKTYTPGAGNIW